MIEYTMTLELEKAFFDFLDNTTDAFTINDATQYINDSDIKNDKYLSREISAYLNTQRIAFKLDSKRWVTRRGCFEKIPFVITPTRLELLNGILIPGHRCIPFANPQVLLQEYKFFWNGEPVPVTTTEASPNDLYPFYCVFGEEFSHQHIIRDNIENEVAYYTDPYDDPPEVSIHTLDMRNIYRKSSFVPGDSFIVRTIDWKEALFNLEKVNKDEWSQIEINDWIEAAETGFERSFNILGPGASTEEQIAFAYWYADDRIRELPAISLEEFLYKKTETIELVSFGIETRFWFIDKEIPDYNKLQNYSLPPDRTIVENLLFEKNIPISEFVVLAYIRDSFFRNELELDKILDRIVPPLIYLEEAEWNILADFIAESIDDFYKHYSLFTDHAAGPIRQRLVELHTAIIELSARLQKGKLDPSWLPKQTFIILSQLQGHSSSLLEELAYDDPLFDYEITALDNSLDFIVDIFYDTKEQIDNAISNFRRSNLTLIHSGRASGQILRIIQISIIGLDIWRRAVVKDDCTMEELHRLIQIGMNWNNIYDYTFFIEDSISGRQDIHNKNKISEISFRGKKELVYEYGKKWIIKILIMSSYQPAKDETTRFVAGDGIAPPETIDGPRQFGKIMSDIESGNSIEKHAALTKLGKDYKTPAFNLVLCNKKLHETEFMPQRNS